MSLLYKFSSISLSSNLIFDLNNDKTKEIIIGSEDNSLYCLSSSGKLIWSYQTEDKIKSSPSIVDLTIDGVAEILFGSNDGKLCCLSLTGVSQSGTGQWYSFRGSCFPQVGWIRIVIMLMI